MNPRLLQILRWTGIVIGSAIGLLFLLLGSLWIYRRVAVSRAEAVYREANDSRMQPPAVRGILEKDNAAIADALKDKDALNTKSISGTTPLALAVDRASAQLVEAMVQGGADPNAPTMSGYTPLMNAVMGKNPSMIATLVKNGANIGQARKGTGETALSVAICDGSPEMVESLLENGADPNTRNPILGTTALQEAVISNNAAVVQILLKAGADPNAPYPNMPGETAATIARQRAVKAQGADKDLIPDTLRDEIVRIWDLLRPHAK